MSAAGRAGSEAASDVPDGLHLTLTDLSPGMVREAKERCSALPFASLQGKQADVTALPFAEESFDTVIAMHMLYHVADPAAAIAEMHRVLQPGGLLAVTTNGLDNMRALYELATAFGGSPHDPVAAIFGYDEARRMMTAIFGNVTAFDYPARLRVTDPEDVFLALTSFPPGETASEAELDAFRQAIGEAFEKGNGMLECRKQTGLFLSRKTV